LRGPSQSTPEFTKLVCAHNVCADQHLAVKRSRLSGELPALLDIRDFAFEFRTSIPEITVNFGVNVQVVHAPPEPVNALRRISRAHKGCREGSIVSSEELRAFFQLREP